ncbi:unnamed protein product [Enterobius vermicularis]|uniref:CA domain-containing protein n=1 Tax=Enterobius vermicularis TaxID=51028 RepID=A0A0N4USS3_ENTVE|nr:unnamed protein product [Enterobius vermicularis]
MTPVLAEVGKVRVYDPDTGLGGLVEIFVQGEEFLVDQTKCSKHHCTTTLRLAKPLDYETQNRHSIVLVARDGARRIKKIHESRLHIFINVIDEQE